MQPIIETVSIENLSCYLTQRHVYLNSLSAIRKHNLLPKRLTRPKRLDHSKK